MREKGKLFDKVVLGAELPMECPPGQPLVEVVGHRRVLIENHQGVIAYSHNEIQVKVCFGQFCIAGNNLELACMSKQQLVIVGQIHGITIFRG